jgi:hypothetical protein
MLTATSRRGDFVRSIGVDTCKQCLHHYRKSMEGDRVSFRGAAASKLQHTRPHWLRRWTEPGTSEEPSEDVAVELFSPHPSTMADIFDRDLPISNEEIATGS